jgi:Ca2+:H+ antiporter
MVGKYFKSISEMNEYIHILINLSGYIFYPFGKFVAKRIVYLPPGHEESEPLLRNEEEEFPTLASSHFGPIRQESNQYIEREILNPTSDDETFSEDIAQKEYIRVYNGFFKTMNRVWKSGPSGVLFFVIAGLILGPIHLISSFICYFFIVSIPSGKLHYYLLRHLLLHTLQLTSHSCDYDPGLISSQCQSSSLNTPRDRDVQGRPKSVFFWRPETTDEDLREESTLLPTIMATPSMRPIQTSQSMSQNREYQIVLCTYRATGLEYYKYTVFGVNIIFINLLSMIALTLFDFYVIGPLNGFTGIASRGVIFMGGILSTVPLAYFIGMAVSSITAHTGSVAIGAVINATFGSIIEIILYAFGLMEGKEELVQGAMIGSLLLGLLALPGASMFSGGLVRSEQRFNAKSATVTSTMLVVSVIGVFTPTIFQNIHGSYHFDCQECPKTTRMEDVVSSTGGKACRSCRIYQPRPREDPIYQSHTKPLMYICAVVLLLTYAIGLYFTLGTHLHKIYPKMKPSKKKNVDRGKQESRRPIVPAEQRLREQTKILFRPVSDPGLLTSSSQQPGPSRLRNPLDALKLRHKSVVSVDDDSSDEESGGHESPGWSIFWSSVVLMACTILYTLIAEILIDCIDEISTQFPISEKTLGLTVFAIVPTVTEFCKP